MKPATILNIAVLIFVAAASYGLTLYFEKNSASKRIITIQDQKPEQIFKSGKKIPHFTFTTPDGISHSINDFKGKVVILNFWASWCAPCVKEFPDLIKATQKFSKDVVFIGLSSDVDEEAMLKFIKKMGISPTLENLHIAFDKNNVTDDIFQISQLPETILIDQKQKMRIKIIGADWTYEDLEAQLQELLK